MGHKHKSPYYGISGEECLIFAAYRYFHVDVRVEPPQSAIDIKVSFTPTRKFGVEFSYGYQSDQYFGECHVDGKTGFFRRMFGAGPIEGALSISGELVYKLLIRDEKISRYLSLPTPVGKRWQKACEAIRAFVYLLFLLPPMATLKLFSKGLFSCRRTWPRNCLKAPKEWTFSVLAELDLGLLCTVTVGFRL